MKLDFTPQRWVSLSSEVLHNFINKLHNSHTFMLGVDVNPNDVL